MDSKKLFHLLEKKAEKGEISRQIDGGHKLVKYHEDAILSNLNCRISLFTYYDSDDKELVKIEVIEETAGKMVEWKAITPYKGELIPSVTERMD